MLNLVLDDAAQRTGAVFNTVTLVDKEFFGTRFNRKGQAFAHQTLAQLADQQVENFADLGASQRSESDNPVKAINQLGAHKLIESIASKFSVAAVQIVNFAAFIAARVKAKFRLFGHLVGAEIASQDDNRITKANFAPLSVSHRPIFQ